MKRFYVSFFVFIFFLSFFTNQKTLFAENHYRVVKAAVGVAAMAGSLALWRNFGKKIEKVEKLQKVFEKIRGVDHGYAERIKKLLLYKHLFLFAALLSCGYTIKQVASRIKEVAEEKAEIEEIRKREEEARKKERAKKNLGGSSGGQQISLGYDVDNIEESIQFYWKVVKGTLLCWMNEGPELDQNDCFFIELENSEQMWNVVDWVIEALNEMESKGNLAQVRNEWKSLKENIERWLKESAAMGPS